jgi:hypothetical protein
MDGGIERMDRKECKFDSVGKVRRMETNGKIYK